MPSTLTRDRILDQAMRLFSEQGFMATTIVQIETAAGLARGAGGVYHHFPSKEAILTAGIERHLERLDALRDIRELFSDLGDLRIELTITARYIFAELDREAELLRILFTESRHHPQLLQSATDRLIGASLDGFGRWLTARSERELLPDEAHALATLTLGGLIASRLLTATLHLDTTVDDETVIRTWVDLLVHALQQ
jgi:AcrR family transcriptional regulator